MIDTDRIARTKADILDACARIDALVAEGKEQFLSDPKSAFALKYLLIEAVEAIVDMCQHLLAKGKGTACEGYIDCIIKAGEKGIITIQLSNKLRRLADLRNNLVHRYWIINDAPLFDQTAANRGDLKEFVLQAQGFVSSLKIVHLGD
ncbi:MAG: DUF86 domain-containing protein [Deltaproteobacteria bacterium]|nr:DUF86 domain-containing protein [Deltaproteobacteria bacterium]